MQLLFWLFPVAFLIHDGEEILTVAGWLRRQGARVPTGFGLLTRVVHQDRSLTGQFAVAVAFLGGVILAGTYTGHLGFFTGALGVMLLDGLKHVALSLRLRQYTPGVATAALVEVPFTVYAFSRLFAAGAVDWPYVLKATAAGVALIGPLLGVGLFLSHSLVRAKPGAPHLF